MRQTVDFVSKEAGGAEYEKLQKGAFVRCGIDFVDRGSCGERNRRRSPHPDIYAANRSFEDAVYIMYAVDTEAGNYWHYVDGVPTKW